jgi:hypothetical protein
MVLCKTMIVLLLAIMMSNLCFHFQPVSFRGCLSSFPVQDLRNYCKVFAWYLCQFQVSTRQFFCHKLSNVSIHFRTMPTSLYYVYICSICMYSSVESPCLYQCLSATYHCCCFRTATSGQNLHLVMFFPAHLQIGLYEIGYTQIWWFITLCLLQLAFWRYPPFSDIPKLNVSHIMFVILPYPLYALDGYTLHVEMFLGELPIFPWVFVCIYSNQLVPHSYPSLFINPISIGFMVCIYCI